MTIILKFLVLLALGVALVSSGIYLPFMVTTILLLVVFVGIASWLMLFAANSDKETTLIPTGEIKFVVEGDSCLKVLANLEGTGWFYEENKKIIREFMDGDIYPSHLLGVYWVSILYPLRQVHVWIFEWTKLLKGDAQKEEDPYELQHRKEYVNSLFLLATYPINAKSVELEGNLQVDISALVTIRIVYPLIPVFVFKGTYLTLVDAAINGAITDLCREKTLDNFREMEKEGPGNVFSGTIMALNDSGKYSPGATNGNLAVILDENRLGNGDGLGIPITWGVAIHKVDFIGFDLSEGSKDAKKATMALEIARLEALADVQRGEGIRAIGKAHADALGERLASAEKVPEGVRALQEQLKMEGVSAFQGSFLSLGGEQPAPAVVVNPKVTEK